MKKIVELYIDFKLQRVKKHYYEDRSLGIRLATVNNLTTLGSILSFVTKQLKAQYKRDPLFGIIDIQSTFVEFLSKLKGDCDDFLLLYYYLLFGAGYNPYYVTLINAKPWYNHTICAVRIYNGLFVLDTTVPNLLGPFVDMSHLMNYYSSLTNSKYILADIRDLYLRKADIK